MIWTVLRWVGMYFAVGTFVYWLTFVWHEKTPVYDGKYLILLWLIWPVVIAVAIVLVFISHHYSRK